MTEKLSINLTEGDVTVRQKENDDPREIPVIEYFAACPICACNFSLTRISTVVCDCNIEWRAEVKIKGTRALDDDDKFQTKMDFEMRSARETTEKPETPEFETIG